MWGSVAWWYFQILIWDEVLFSETALLLAAGMQLRTLRLVLCDVHRGDLSEPCGERLDEEHSAGEFKLVKIAYRVKRKSQEGKTGMRGDRSCTVQIVVVVSFT